MGEIKAKTNPILGVIDVQRRRLRPDENLQPEVKAIFLNIVDHCSPDHFKVAEKPLLTMYCKALALADFFCDRIGAEGDTGRNARQWNENARLALSIATKLRLTCQARFDGRAAERKAGLPNDESEAPWVRFGGMADERD